VALALVTDVVPQVYLHDKNNFAVSTLICAQLTTGKFMAVYKYVLLVVCEVDDPVTLHATIKVDPLVNTDQVSIPLYVHSCHSLHFMIEEIYSTRYRRAMC